LIINSFIISYRLTTGVLLRFNHTDDSIRLLHVDDDKNQLTMFREFMRIFDPQIEIESTSLPGQVMGMIRGGRYDCLVTDFQMPGMNGIELTQAIREESSIPIILYTGMGSEEIAEKAFEVGVNDYFRKEMNHQHCKIIAKRIRDVVEKQRFEQIYTDIVNEATEAIIIILDHKIVFANRELKELLGASSTQELLGMNIKRLLKSFDKVDFLREVEGLIRGDIPHLITEFEVERSDGEKVPVEVNMSLLDYLGETAFLCFLRDITDRHILNNEIIRSETRYRNLMELAPDGIVTVNLRGDVTWMNDAYSSITGFTKDEIVGRKIWSVGPVRAGDVLMFFRAFFNLLRGKDIPPMEFQWFDKDGNLGWGEGRASLLKIDGKITEVLLIIRDTTERKEMEEELRRYSEEMEQLAETRAQKLLESEKMVAAGAIASSVAHDLRGPLSAIKNALYMMERRPDDSDRMRGIISRAVDNAVDMLNDIQSKITEEHYQVEDVEVSSFLDTIIKETPIPEWIKVSADLREARVRMDRLKMRRVLENLIRNACDAMPRSGKLHISNWVEGKDLHIEVRDNGVGIPRDKLSDLFKPFTTSKDSGMGLGLYFCKKTVEAHNGDIEVESRVGRGTSFTVTIPCRYPQGDEAQMTAISQDVELHQG
jgi:PAS domain S-box-containing protein